MYALQLFDTYAPSYALLTVGLVECIAIGWVYGKLTFWGVEDRGCCVPVFT